MRKEISLMIKGVTKSIIEIAPKNACFEKIIVILNSSCDEYDPDEIKREAELLTNRAPDYLRRQNHRSRLKLWLCGTACAFASAAALLIIYSFV